MLKLDKKLNLLDIFSMSLEAMISSGIFILPGLAFSKAELATAMPRAGGSHFYIDRSMGPAEGTVGGIAAGLSLTLKRTFALLGIGATLAMIWPEVTIFHSKLLAIFFTVFFIAINIMGIKLAGRVQVTLVGILFLILIFYIVSGSSLITPQNFKPFFPKGGFSLNGNEEEMKNLFHIFSRRKIYKLYSSHIIEYLREEIIDLGKDFDRQIENAASAYRKLDKSALYGLSHIEGLNINNFLYFDGFHKYIKNKEENEETDEC